MNVFSTFSKNWLEKLRSLSEPKRYTLSLTHSGAASLEGYGIPYQLSDGSWRMKFDIKATAFGTVGSISITIDGITTPNRRQACSIAYSNSNGSYMNSWAEANSSDIVGYSENTVNWATFETYISGDIELANKPDFV